MPRPCLRAFARAVFALAFAVQPERAAASTVGLDASPFAPAPFHNTAGSGVADATADLLVGSSATFGPAGLVVSRRARAAFRAQPVTFVVAAGDALRPMPCADAKAAGLVLVAPADGGGLQAIFLVIAHMRWVPTAMARLP
ncbi:MAG: hypothetical protein ACKVPY_00490 [Paracoccaceae bacterium]